MATAPALVCLMPGSVLSDQNAIVLEYFISPKAFANYLVKHTFYRFEVRR